MLSMNEERIQFIAEVHSAMAEPVSATPSDRAVAQPNARTAISQRSLPLTNLPFINAGDTAVVLGLALWIISPE